MRAASLEWETSDVVAPAAARRPSPHPFGSLHHLLAMSHRVSALSQILHSPARILSLILLVVFATETAVMLSLWYLLPPSASETTRTLFDAACLTLLSAPALWWIIIGPLRRIALQEHLRSETIVANAAEGIVTFDEDGTITSINRAASELFQLTPAEVASRTLYELIPNLPRDTGQLPTQLRATAALPDDRRVSVEVSVSSYPTDAQPLRIAIIRDLTEAEQAEQQRVLEARKTEAIRAQQMATLAQLATGVAHEIRNPLTSIKMLVQINRDKFAENGLPTDDLALVEDEIRRMERSVNSLLEYARPEKPQFQILALDAAVNRSLQLVEAKCRQHAIRIAYQRGPNVKVRGDEMKLTQLIVNLLLNAVDAMPDGGEIQLAITTQANDHAQPHNTSAANAPAAAETVILTVTDQGHGVAADVADSLFEPFQTSKPSGVGLGLGICRQIAELHNGDIRWTNREQGGAQFELHLPIHATEDAGPAATHTSQSGVSSKGGSVKGGSIKGGSAKGQADPDSSTSPPADTSTTACR